MSLKNKGLWVKAGLHYQLGEADNYHGAPVLQGPQKATGPLLLTWCLGRTVK